MTEQRLPWTERFRNRIDPFAPTPNPEQNLRELTAAAQRIELGNPDAIKAVLAAREDWQKQAIDAITAIGQLQYGLSVPASLVGRVIYYVAKMPDETDGSPVRAEPSDPGAQEAIDTLDRLGNAVMRADLQYDLAFQLLGPGECYLCCVGPREEHPERWMIRSVREVEASGNTVKIWDDFVNRFIVLDQPGDTFIRIYRPDPFDHAKATSHVRSILSSAEELLWWQSAAVSVAMNRLTMAGLIGVPNNLEVPSESDEEAKLDGSTRFIKRFLKNIATAIKNPRSAPAAAPVLFTYPWNEQGKSGLEVIEFTRPQDELLESRILRCLMDIEQGINLPAGVVSGLGTATHWGGSQIEESVFRDHVEPLVILSVNALTKAFLQPTLRKQKSDESDRYFIWYDASNLIVHRDKSANALRGNEMLLINDAATRRELGWSETDAMTDEEMEKKIDALMRMRGRGPKEALIEQPTDANPVPEDPNAPPQQNEPGKRTSEDKKTAATRGKGRDPIAASAETPLNGSSEVVLARIQTFCDEKCRRALEIAGNRLANRAKRNPAYKEAIRGVKTREIASTLGREAVTKLGVDDLFDGAFDDVHSRVIGMIPADFLAIDTIRPINHLIAELRVLCAAGLFSPPTSETFVPMELVEKVVIASLSNEPVSV